MDTRFHPLRAFLLGFFLPLTSTRLVLREPALLTRAAIPLALTVGVIWFLGESLKTGIQGLLLGILTWAGVDPSGWVGLIVGGIALVSALVVGVVVFSGVGSLIATPFNDWLAEATEKHTTPVLLPAPTPSVMQTLRHLLLDFFKTLVSMAALAGAFLLSLIPVLQFAAPVIAAYALVFQYLTYPQTRRGEGVSKSLEFMKQNPALCLGFGFSHLLLFSIPIVSAFTLPVAVVGGTLLYAAGKRNCEG